VKHQESQQISAFIRTNGYSVIPDVFASADLAEAERQLVDPRLKRSRAGARHVLSCSAVAEIASLPALLEMARSVLGPEALPFRATFFDKSPDSNWLVAWHQDTALPLAFRVDAPGWGPWSLKDGIHYAHAPANVLENVLALRVHLDDSTSLNGPLRVIPGTHLNGVRTDGEISDCAEKSHAIECTVRVGGVIAIHPLVIHASSKSECQSPRRVLHIEYASHLKIHLGLQLAIV